MASCANCIHHSLCDYNTNISGNGKIRLVYAEGADVKCSFFQNTADVVPKSEVEELIRENESLAKTVNEASELIRKLRSKVKKSKSEVAREIFEKIESLLYLNQLQGDIFVGKYFDADLENDIAELKKKYTEVETMDEKKHKREENDS